MLHILHHRARLVALEAFTTPDVSALVRSVAGDIHTAFGDFTARFAPSQKGLQLTSQQGKFVREVAKHNYVSLRGITLFAPEGLKSSYLEYANILVSAVRHCAEMPSSTLVPFATMLSEMVNNRGTAQSAFALAAKLAELESTREIFNRSLGGCFESGSNVTERPMGDLIARNNDWPIVLHTTDECVQTINRVDRNKLAKKMHECVELLDIIQQRLHDRAYGDISPQVANALAGGAYQVARELEFYAATYYRVQVLSEALNQSVDKLQEIFSR